MQRPVRVNEVKTSPPPKKKKKKKKKNPPPKKKKKKKQKKRKVFSILLCVFFFFVCLFVAGAITHIGWAGPLWRNHSRRLIQAHIGRVKVATSVVYSLSGGKQFICFYYYNIEN